MKMINRSASLLVLAVSSVIAGCVSGDTVPKYRELETMYYSGPPTVSTCFWQVPAYPEISMLGPEQAVGAVLYSHGQSGGLRPSWTRPPVRIIHTRFAKQGWDVIKVQRNERCAGRWSDRGAGYVKDFVQRIEKLKEAGYRRIVVAGQSFGAGIVLGAAGRNTNIDGVLAFALSHGRGSCRQASTFRYEMIGFHERQIRNAIRASKAPRIVIVLAKDDHCIGHSFTPTVNAELSRKQGTAWIYLDESSAVSGHGAANRRRFDSVYGECLHQFVSDEIVVPRRHTCD